MRKQLLIIALMITCAASAQQKLRLHECIDMALENNLSVKQQDLNRQSREIAYRQARADLLPDLNASAGQSFVFGRSIGLDNTYQNTNSSQTSFGIGSSITLFDGLRMKYNIDARRADLNASEADLEQIREMTIMSVSTAFLQVLLNKELLQLAEQQIALTQANIDRRKELISNGKMAQGTLYELEAQYSREELNRIKAENDLKLALLDLAQIIEIDYFADFDIIAPSDEEFIGDKLLLSSEAIYQEALTNRPEIRGATYRLESSEKQVLISKAQLFPTLSFGVNMGTGYYDMSGRTNDPFGSQLRNNMSTSIGFNLRIPIFNKFQIKHSIQNAELAVANNRLEIDKAKLDLRKRIEQAYYNAMGAHSRWEAAQKSEIADREAYRFAVEKYENGRANVYELFQAKNNLTQALGEKVQAKYEYAFRLKILELLKD